MAASPKRPVVELDSATTSLSKAHATAADRRDGASSPSRAGVRERARQFVLNGRKIDTRGCKAIVEAAQKKGPPMWGPERRYCGEKDVIAMGEISRQS